MIIGCDEVLKNMQANGTNRIVLPTDGYGVTEIDRLIAKSKEFVKKGVEITTYLEAAKGTLRKKNK